MIFRFSHFATSFQCNYCPNNVVNKIIEMDNHEHNGITFFSTVFSPDGKITISTKPDECILKNSFLPLVQIYLSEIENGTLISTSFELKKSIKTFIALYCSYGLLLEVLMFALCMFNQFSITWPLFIPLAMIIFCIAISYIGLYLSSKKVFTILYNSLQ